MPAAARPRCSWVAGRVRDKGGCSPDSSSILRAAAIVPAHRPQVHAAGTWPCWPPPSVSPQASKRSGDAMNAIAEELVQSPAATRIDEPWVDLGQSTFDPWRIMAVQHRLSGHPLLQPDALLALGERLEARGSIRSHASGAKPGTPFNSAPELFPNPKAASDTLRAVADAKAWTSLLNVQIDPTYRGLVAEVLESVRTRVESVDPGMCHRGGWIFITSPDTVTPFHFDKEHNFILQIHGKKRIYVWDHRDTVV